MEAIILAAVRKLRRSTKGQAFSSRNVRTSSLRSEARNLRMCAKSGSSTRQVCCVSLSHRGPLVLDLLPKVPEAILHVPRDPIERIVLML